MGLAEGLASPPAEGAALIGRYVVLERLGSGAMGVVYAAYDPVLDRRVALKLVRSGKSEAGAEERRARLVREAQAMAQVVHPNVIAVHDAGTHEQDVFIAMDLVAGVTLRAWLAARPRRWREIVAVFLGAGRGLEAAHRAGVVHRDFKPDNVLVRPDGHPLVGDFGLARAEGGLDATITPMPGRYPSRSDSLTETGVIVGTPAYMAPEQHQGEATDGRTDQFAFSVALYEALYGRRPFVPEASEETGGLTPGDALALEVSLGRVRPPPRQRGVPARLGKLILRGLSREPEARYPSMSALLAELERDPARRWRQAGAAGAVVALAVGVVLVARGRHADPCAGGGERLAGVWDEPTRGALRAAFGGAGDDLARVSGILDEYAASWLGMRGEACRAAVVRHEQSSELMDLRMQCLDRRLSGLRALTTLLARPPDRDVVTHAVDAALALDPLDGCADAAGLRAAFPPPPALLRARVAATEAQVDQGNALLNAGALEAALPVAGVAAAEAESISYPPLRARALYLLERLHFERQDGEVVATAIRAALAAAADAHDDDMTARVLTDLVQRLGTKEARIAEGLALVPAADAAVRRAGDDPLLRATLIKNTGEVMGRAGHAAEGIAFAEVALAMAERAPGVRPLELTPLMYELADELMYQEKFDRSKALAERALDIVRGQVGPRHPKLAPLFNLLGAVAYHQQRYEDALARYREGEAILRAAAPSSATLRVFEGNIAQILTKLGRKDEARAHLERLLAEHTAELGPDNVEVADDHLNLGIAYASQGDGERARPQLERAAEIIKTTYGPDHPLLSTIYVNLGMVLMDHGQREAACPRLEEALRLARLKGMTDSIQEARVQQVLGECYVLTGRPKLAIPLLEKAVTILAKGWPRGASRPDALFLLGRAMWDSGGDRARARSLVREARGLYDEKVAPKRIAQAEEWLAKH